MREVVTPSLTPSLSMLYYLSLLFLFSPFPVPSFGLSEIPLGYSLSKSHLRWCNQLLFVVCYRLEAYDRNANFGSDHVYHQPPYKMSLPDLSLYKDVNTKMQVCSQFLHWYCFFLVFVSVSVCTKSLNLLVIIDVT